MAFEQLIAMTEVFQVDANEMKMGGAEEVWRPPPKSQHSNKAIAEEALTLVDGGDQPRQFLRLPISFWKTSSCRSPKSP